MQRRTFLKGLAGAACMPSQLFASTVSDSSLFPESIMRANFTPSSGELQLLYGQMPIDITGHVFLLKVFPSRMII